MENLITDTNEFNKSYVTQRLDVVGSVPEDVTSIIDVGSSNGNMAAGLKRKIPVVMIVGIENDRRMSQSSKRSLDLAINSDINKLEYGDSLRSFSDRYDCLIFADILVH